MNGNAQYVIRNGENLYKILTEALRNVQSEWSTAVFRVGKALGLDK